MIDTHCHLDSEVFFEDVELALERAKQAGIHSFIIPGANIKDLNRAKDLAHQYPEVYFASGVHPYHLDTYSLETLKSVLDEG